MAQKQEGIPNTFLWIGYVLIIAAGLAYVFWSGDLIPDAVGAIGYIDDIGALVLMFIALAKWRQIIFGTKNKPGQGWKGALVALPIIAIIVVYVFWAYDLIPDSIPVIGYMDDLAAIVLGVYLLAKWRRYLKGKK